MRLRAEVLDQLLDHAFEASPAECCGLIAGHDGEGTALYRVRNTSRKPDRFELSLAGHLRSRIAIRARGEKVLAVYHSHPRSAAFPSHGDIAGADPDLVNVITSIAEGGSTRAFRIRDGVVDRVEIHLT